MIPGNYFLGWTEKQKGALNKKLAKDHAAHVVEQGCLTQDVTGTNAQIVTIVYLVRPIQADLGEVKLASRVFEAFVRTILTLLNQLKGDDKHGT
jgi:hypothetical protein